METFLRKERNCITKTCLYIVASFFSSDSQENDQNGLSSQNSKEKVILKASLAVLLIKYFCKTFYYNIHSRDYKLK